MALAVGVMLWAEGSSSRTIRLTPPWAAGEFSDYTVMRSVSVGGSAGDFAAAPAIGRAQLAVADRGDHIALIFDYHDPELAKRSEVIADAASLQPLASVITRESPQAGQAVITTDYSSGGAAPDGTGSAGARPAADIEVTSARGVESVRRELPEGVYYDTEQTVQLLRAMPLKQRFAATVNVLDTPGASPISARVRVVGQETVRVPAGEFECWRIDVQGLSMRAWVAITPPHQLVMFELVARGATALLAEYAQGGGD